MRPEDGGAEGIRTPDPHNAIVVLYQLSYDPILWAANVERGPRFVKAVFRVPGYSNFVGMRCHRRGIRGGRDGLSFNSVRIDGHPAS